jgi:hypothetical protein
VGQAGSLRRVGNPPLDLSAKDLKALLEHGSQSGWESLNLKEKPVTRWRPNKKTGLEYTKVEGYVIKVSIPTAKFNQNEVDNTQSPVVMKNNAKSAEGRLYLNFNAMTKRHIGGKKK